MMYELGKEKLLSPFINVTFANFGMKEFLNVTKKMTSILDEYRKAKPLLKRSQEIKEKLNSFSIANWQNPTLFEKLRIHGNKMC